METERKKDGRERKKYPKSINSKIEESDTEIHFHLNYLLLLRKKSLRRQTSPKESMSMEKTLQTQGLPTTLLVSRKKTKQMEKHLNSLNSEILKVSLKIHKRKTK